MIGLRHALPEDYAECDRIAHECGLPGDWSIERAIDRGCWAIAFDGGFFLAHPFDERSASVHAVILPGMRGCKALTAGRMAIQAAFEACDVDELVSTARDRAARMFTVALGFKAAGDRLLRLHRKDWQWEKH